MATQYQQQAAPAQSQAQGQQQVNTPTLILPQGYYPFSQAGGTTESPIIYVVVSHRMSRHACMP